MIAHVYTYMIEKWMLLVKRISKLNSFSCPDDSEWYIYWGKILI